jgi:ribosomal subunit interface protein
VDVAVIACKDVVPEDVQAVARSKVAKVGRRAPVLEQAQVRLAEARDEPGLPFVCEVTMVGHGHRVRAKAAAREVAAAVDLVVEKLEHQVERLKGKQLARSHPRHRPLAGSA